MYLEEPMTMAERADAAWRAVRRRAVVTMGGFWSDEDFVRNSGYVTMGARSEVGAKEGVEEEVDGCVEGEVVVVVDGYEIKG